MRKLASIQRVLAIDPIEDADRIVSTRINGWRCVTKKGDFAVGDLGVFLEIDAIPPDIEAFRFLWTKRGDAAGPRPDTFRIRTMRLRGSLSQGLLLPLSELGLAEDLAEGTDVTEALGVAKYERPLPIGGDARAGFPSRVPKTDEIRVQSMPALIEELREQPYVATLKCDGASATYLVDPEDEELHVCSRNYSLLPGRNAYWQVARELELEDRLRSVGGRFALQGELCGPGLQKNRLGLSAVSWFAFDAWDLQEQRRLDHDELTALCDDLELPQVPVVEQGEAFDHDLDSLLSLADGHYPYTRNQREGLVFRSRQGAESPTLGKRLSFKVISNQYLLAER